MRFVARAAARPQHICSQDPASNIARFAAAAILSIALSLPGCSKLTPIESGTMGLLHAGNDKVCIAPDVQKGLRDQIVPKAVDLPGDDTPQDKQNAINTISLSYDQTTLKSFDKAVSKATCSTTVRISGPDGKSAKYPVSFELTPSAENGGMFVVTASVDDASAFARTLIDQARTNIEDANNAAGEANLEEDSRRRLLVTVNEKWLQGAWIMASASAESCGNGQALWFEKGHVLEGVVGTGRWALGEDKLHLIAQAGSSHTDETFTIDEADAVSFHASKAGGQFIAARRCSPDEINALPPVTQGAGQ